MANPFFDTPRIRRLKRDLEEMKVLAEQSSIITFRAEGLAPEQYEVTFRGTGLANEGLTRNLHTIGIDLGLEYPRMIPKMQWKTPIHHPNIQGGNPCFGTFVMNPNVRLVDIVEILWDMARLASYNPYGGYGDNSQWQILRKKFDFPVDKRILRDKIPVVERPPEEEGEADLIIMGRHSLGAHLPPSQQWVKMALEQYFESRGLENRAQVFTADEWNATGQRPRFDDAVGTLVLDQDLYAFLNEESEDAEFMRDDLWRLFEKLGVLPNPGMGNVLPLLPIGF